MAAGSTVAKVLEISSSSKSGIEDAVQAGLKKVAKSVKNIKGAWINDIKVVTDAEAIGQAAKQPSGQDALVIAQGCRIPLRPIHVVDRHEGRLAAHGQAYIALRQMTVDLMAQRRENKSTEEQMRLKFLTSNPMLRNMDAGAVSSVLTDQATKCHFIVRVAEKAEPDYSKMSDGELLQMKAQLERARSYQPVQRWQYADISRRRDLKVNN